ncbi:penicillin-binding transpeptidase domain-containing protein [Specibacter cremeus]|uniref:penicillin-binding transpeptidase domain-containing protein n=1 Tax=Specibacter cremeus TaxID=1629051 RepID=UPI000F788D79|nr:penicillin-binding transpeptidase domain-containing protein [Specibacter cremeus]
MLRRVTGLAVVLALLLAGTACAPKDDGTSTARALAEALGAHTVGSVQFDTPAADVQKRLTALFDGVDPVWPKVALGGVEKVDDTHVRATLDYTWTVPRVKTPWQYKANADLTRAGDGWTVHWSAAIVQPRLAEGERLEVRTVDGKRADILAGDGAPIVTDRPVRVVGINKQGLSDAEARASATALAAVVGVDPAAFAARVLAYGPVAFVDAVTLRQDAFDALDQEQLKSIKGFLAVPGQLPLAPTRTFASAVLGSVREATAEDIKKSKGAVTAGQTVGASGLQAAFDARLAGSPGVSILAVAAKQPADGGTPESHELFSTTPVDGTAVKTTLVPALQEAAEKALAGVKSPSAIVAVRPSTGAILAAANGPDSDGYNTAFLGRYTPGSTFKMATSLGLFRTGLTPTSTVQCDPSYVADGKKFQNATGYDPAVLGKITLTTAIAHSCNTAFVSEFGKLSQPRLADAAGALGIGMTNDLGLDAFTGALPRDDTGTAHAASMIGQGKVLVSPLAMATMMATIVKGQVVVPRLVDGHDGAAKPAAGATLTAPEAAGLRTMMRAVVTDGYLTDLLGLPGGDVIGKTGTAEYGTDNPPRTHSWVIAAQGDTAIAVFVEDGDLGAITGGPLAQAVLQAAAGG